MYELKEFPDKHTVQYRVFKDGKQVACFRGKHAKAQAEDYVAVVKLKGN